MLMRSHVVISGSCGVIGFRWCMRTSRAAVHLQHVIPRIMDADRGKSFPANPTVGPAARITFAAGHRRAKRSDRRGEEARQRANDLLSLKLVGKSADGRFE